MATIVQFVVDDSSPAIQYTPFGDALSLPPIVNQGWNPYFTESGFASALGVKGNGTSYHVTSRNGASLTINWKGTGIQLQGNVTEAASYAVSVDGVSFADDNLGANVPRNVLATISGLKNEDHTLILTTQIPSSALPSSTVAFRRAIIASNMTSFTNTVDSLFPLTYLNDNDVAYLGKWSFANDGPVSSHQSNSAGDRATATFRGVAFVLQGTTSPQAGNYSVTVDNRTVSYSARSTFLAHETLLHYSTGLDPNLTHTVTVTNQGGGSLSLLEGGFGFYSSGDSATPTPVPVSSQSAPFSKGTIAAFALSGVLACLLMIAVLYFCFIYRPRKKYQMERERWRLPHPLYQAPKTDEAGVVLDISPTAPEQAIAYPLGVNPTNRSQRQLKRDRRESAKSGRSSFSRWKREVETAVARDSLGVQFRHSNMYSEKDDAQYDDGTLQSTSDRTQSSRSPSIFRNAMFMANIGKGSRDSHTGKHKSRNKGRESRRPPLPEVMLSSRTQASTGSLSYVTAPPGQGSAAGETHPGAPPSYTDSVSYHGSDSPPSVPRSVTQSSSIPTILPSSNKGKSRAEQPGSPVTSQTSSVTPPYPVRDLSKEDRGSLMDQSIDESPTVLSGTAVRQLLRSLSPRTSRASFPRHRSTAMSLELGSISPSSPVKPQQFQQPRRVVRPLPVPPSPAPPSPLRSEAHLAGNESEATSPTTEEAAIVTERGPVRCSGTFGPGIQSISVPGLEEGVWQQAHGASSPTPGTPSSITFPRHSARLSAVPSSSSGPFSKRVSRLIPPAENVQGPSRQQFRLTPASLAPLPALPVRFAEPQGAGARDSFLDFTTSSDVSAHSHSHSKDNDNNNTDSSSLREDTRRYSTPPQTQHGLLPEVRSRWSSSNSGRDQDPRQDNDNDDDNDNNESGTGNEGSSSSKSKTTGVFATPTPITIPPSSQFLQPHQHPRFSISETSTRSDPVHVHPPLEYLESPTDSIPMSASSGEVGFRHSDSDDMLPPLRSRVLIEGSTSVRTSLSSLYAATHAPTEAGEFDQLERNPSPPTPPPAGLSSPNFLVQRVLGLHSPTSSITARPLHSRTGSTSAFTTSPFNSGRFEENPSHLRHATSDTEISRTMQRPKDTS